MNLLSRSRIRSAIVMLAFLGGCGIWLFVGGRAQLSNNLAMVGLLDSLPEIQPPEPDEILGLRIRTRQPELGSSPEMLAKLSAIQPSSRLRGAMLAASGQLEAAEAILKASSANDNISKVWLAFVYGQSGRGAEALQTLGSIRGADTYLAFAGLREARLGHPEVALQILSAAASLDTGTMRDRVSVYRTLSEESYTHSSDWSAAVDWTNRWLQVAPNDISAYVWLSSLYLWRGQPERAFEVLQQGEPFGVESSRYYPGLMGQIFQSRGNWEQAIQAYRNAWGRSNDDAGMLASAGWYLGFALYHEGRGEEARPYLDTAIRSGSDSLKRQATDILSKLDAGRVR